MTVSAVDVERNLGAPAPRSSAEIFIIPIEPDRFLIYAPLRRAAFVANTTMVNVLVDLKDGRDGAPRDLSGPAIEFLRRLEIVDAGPETPPVTTFSGVPRPAAVTLFLTTACNLRCTYCYASAGDTPLRSMRIETAERGIRYVASNAADMGASRFSVAYHGGGEPSANWAVMAGSLDYARRLAGELGLGVDADAATNGVLRDDQIDWMAANLRSASVSFDGLPEMHDLHRPTATGLPSSGRVMHTIRRFDAAGFRYGVRMTVTSDQIPRLAESVDFVCSHFRPERVQVEPSYQLGRWVGAPSAETEAFIEAYREAHARARALGTEVTYSAARLDTLTNHFCGVTQDSFALSPDGNVSGCYEVFSESNALARVFFYGKPDETSDGYVFNLPVLERLRGQAVQHREFCRGCFAKWHCAGDCYHKSLATSGHGEFQGSDRCNITRELLKDQILDRIARTGGAFWHEAPVADPCSAEEDRT